MNTKIVDMALGLAQRVPMPVVHNLEKALMIKKLIWQLNVDKTEGDYFEFGVAQGNSIKAAELAIKRARYTQLGISALDRKIWGFDTFTGFTSPSEIDSHGTWSGSKYNDKFEIVKKRFRNSSNVTLIQCDACSLTAEGSACFTFDDFGIPEESRAGLVLLDMDLYAPTKSALDWMKPKLGQGTFVIFDELYYFAAREDRGELRALRDFQNQNTDIQLVHIDTYGAGGQVFVVSKR